MRAEEFKDKLEDFLHETVGASWQWLKEDEQDDTLIIKSLCVWGFDEPCEEFVNSMDHSEYKPHTKTIPRCNDQENIRRIKEGK